MSGDCRVCGSYTMGSVCSPCLASESDVVAKVATSTPLEQDYTQAQAQAQAQVKDHVQTISPTQPPEPGCNSEGTELHRLVELNRNGQLEPADVQLGELPPHAGVVMRNIADHMRLLMGLRRAVGDDRSLPYARSMAVNAGLADNLGTASNAICALVRAGVIDHVGSLPPLRPGIDGTKLYAPPAHVVSLSDRKPA